MSLLAPLYALGIFAVTLPVLFHLIRRAPREEIPFSTLMFLSPSPPRLTRRSRLDNLLLLLVRGMILTLLAAAFARPFINQVLPAAPLELKGRRTAIVLDTSASMRRTGLWEQALAHVANVLTETRSVDETALFLCDSSLRPLFSFEELRKLEPGERAPVLESRLADTTPTWRGTHLGRGLTEASNLIRAAVGNDAVLPEMRLVLISDLQEGGRFDELVDYEWPSDVALELLSVRPANPTNASVQIPTDQALAVTDDITPASSNPKLRIRVASAPDSLHEDFQVVWQGDGQTEDLATSRAAVPAGESRVVSLTLDGNAPVASRVELRGDAHDFDNHHYLVRPAATGATLLFIGPDAEDDPAGLAFYLKRAIVNDSPTGMRFAAISPESSLPKLDPRQFPCIVVGSELGADATARLKSYIEEGGTLLAVVRGDEPAGSLGAWLDTAPFAIEKAEVSDYVMLGQIAFDHPIFAPVAAPQFNDFTQIHFWKYRRLPSEALRNAQVLARFDNSDPALVERSLGKGSLLILLSGWQPDDSQLARSWKFVLLMTEIARLHSAPERSSFLVGEPIPIELEAQSSTVTLPDGNRIDVESGAAEFRGTTMPGIYTVVSSENRRTVAVNLDPRESRTRPISIDTLEQFGCRLVERTRTNDQASTAPEATGTLLEGRQKAWQWLIAATLVLVVLETWIAGRLSGPVGMEGAAT